MVPPVYESQRWLFETAVGRFDVDLSTSGTAARATAELLAKAADQASYSLDRGSATLRDLVAAAYGVGRECVAITHGAQEAMYLLMASTLKAGDEVALHTPGWQQITDLPQRFGAGVTSVPVGDGERLDLRALADAGRSARLITLNSPHNPTGLIVDQRHPFAELLPVIAENDVLVVNDEEYLTDYRDSIVHRLPGSCSVSSLSKVYGFAGLRVGWLVGPPPVVEACVNYRRYTTICNSPILESVAVMVLCDRQRYLSEYKEALAERWSEFEAWAQGEKWLQVRRPHGTPYALCAYDLPISSDEMLCEYLLDTERVLLMPGSVFRSADTVRISFARPPDILADGLGRVTKAICAL